MKILPDFVHLRILGSTVYVFIYKKKQKLKSEKFVLHALKSKLVGFNGYIIYRIYIEEQNQVIKVTDVYIFKDTKNKENTLLPSYKIELIF